MTKFLGLLSFLIMAGCVTGHVIKESTYPIDDIRNAILAISGPPRSVSSNKREFVSSYFSRKKDPSFDPQKAKERLYAKFTILGDRRPYDIQVQVFIEERVEGEYEEAGIDDALSEQIGMELKRELTKRPETRNVIDDFRAF
jgi:hypothetical protein